MRVFETVSEAISEVRRDIYKGTPLMSSRVQQQTGKELPGRERLGYSYSIAGGWPETPQELVALAADSGMTFWQKGQSSLIAWLNLERENRLMNTVVLDPVERFHPALKSTFEGNWPSYLYSERLLGALDAMEGALSDSPDSRRAGWPIFRPEDAIRAGAPTRIPCSLYYQAVIRKVGAEEHLMLFYVSRSVDFDVFWISDIWLAHEFQKTLAKRLKRIPGQLVHMVISFHSFLIEGTEIY